MTVNYSWPTLSGYAISSKYGDSRDNGSRSHAGVDIAVPVGSDVYAIAPGKVLNTGYTSARGNYITLDHGDGVTSLYEHLSSLAASVGQTVGAGDLIAKSGNTGKGTGPHLHYEIAVNGKTVDPLNYSFAEAQVNRNSENQIVGVIKKYWYLIAAGVLIFAVFSK